MTISRTSRAALTPIDTVRGPDGALQGWPSLSTGTGFWSSALLPFFFQFFPETLTDSRPPNWQDIPVPGGSHPLVQWVQGGKRSINFDAIFARDTSGSFLNEPSAGRASQYERDINAAVSALRWFTYPHYDRNGRVQAPSRLRLTLEGVKIGVNHTNFIYAVMTTCDVNYQALFPDGSPRIVRVTLGFDEIVQVPRTGVKFIGRQTMFDAEKVKYGLTNRGLDPVRE